MKHILHFLLFVIVATSALAQVYRYPSVTPSGHTLYYDIANGEASVAKMNYSYPNYGNTLDGDLIIPDSVVYEGVKYPVTSIGHEAFEYATMRSVQIPNTVRTIVIRAFSACDSLTSLVIPNSVTSIGMQAFAGSFNITSIVLPDSLTVIEQGIFENDTSLISVVVPDAVVSVGHGAFSQCYSLRSVTFGASVASIGRLTFWNCYALDSLIFKSDVAPSVGANMFPGAPDALVLDIPCGSYNSYLSTFGAGHTYVLHSVNLTINVFSANLEYGEAIVVQDNIDNIMRDVRCDSSAVIFAIPNYGYHFVMWNDGDTSNPRIVDMTVDTNFTALFAKNRYNIVTNVSYEFMGVVLGGGLAEYLDSITLTAVPNYGYHFTHWGDGVTDNPRAIVATKDSVFSASFDYNQYTITLNVDTSIHGSVIGSGTYNYLSERTFTASASYGYHFTTWNDGNTNNPRTITLTQDTQFVALFDKNQYTVTGITNDSIRGIVFGSATVDYLDSVTLSAMSNYGYHFLRWSDYHTENPRKVAATGNINMTAIFDVNQYTISLFADTSTHGTVSGAGEYNYLSERTFTASASYGYHFTAWNDGNTNNPRTIILTRDTVFTALFAKNTYTITAISADTIKGNVTGGNSIEYLGSVTITANPNYGFHFSAWNDGNTDNPRIIVATRDSVFTASFDYNQYTITLNVDTNIPGSVVGSGSYNYLSEQTITAMANYGYHFTAWSDGDTNNPRNITLTQDTSFTAIFAKNQYTLTLQSDDVAHGSVIGGGVFDYLDTVAVEATAVEHYHFVNWNDGNTDNPRQYVITGDNIIIATFAIDTHHVSVESCNIAFGSVEGSGDFEYGTPATVTATGYSGYQFVRWSDGSTYNPYTFAVLQDTTLVAIFEAETQGIDDAFPNAVNVYAIGSQIVVVTELKDEISIYDIVGRKVDRGYKTRFDVPASGVYLVKIGSLPTQKVVVVK